MTRTAARTSFPSTDPSRLQLLFNELDELAERNPALDAFVDQVLSVLADAADAPAGIVWRAEEEGGMRCVDTLAIDAESLAKETEFARDILLNADQAFHTGLPDVILPTEAGGFDLLNGQETLDGHGQDAPASTPAEFAGEIAIRDLVLEFRQLLIPLQRNGRVICVYSLFQRSDIEAEVQWGNAELTAIQQRIERLTERIVFERGGATAGADSERAQLARQKRLTELARVVGSKLDRTDVAYDIVNELHRYFGEGRISFAYVRGQSCKIAAVSNQQVFDQRSAAIMAIRRLGAKVAAIRRPIWHPEDADRLPANIRRLFDLYYEAADAQSIALIPLILRPEPSSDPNNLSAVVRDRDAEPGKVVGVVTIEGMQRGISRADLKPQWDEVEQIIVNASANASRHASLFLLPLWKFLGSIADLFRGHHRNKALAATAAAIALGLALTMVQTDLKLRSNGLIQPVDRSRVYAEADGVVEELLVEAGQWVEAGQVLARLDNPQLDAEIARVEGELREAGGQLRTMKLERILGEFKDDEKRQENVRQSAGLTASVEKLQQQYELLIEKHEQLTIRSPVSGQVITWDLPRRLGGRPVQPGQHLLTVADANGPWELEIKMPDKRSGHLLTAWDESGQAEPLTVTYVLASQPTNVYTGVVRHISRSAEVDSTEGNIVRVNVSLDEHPNTMNVKTRPGTEVIAHVHAGQASLGYCKLYEVAAWLKRLSFKFF